VKNWISSSQALLAMTFLEIHPRGEN